MLQGTVKIEVDGRELLFEEGEAALIPPQSPHRFFAHSDRCLYLWLIPDNSMYPAIKFARYLHPTDHRVRDERIRTLLREIHEECDQKNEFYQEIVRAKILEMTVLYCRSLTERVVDKDSAKSDNAFHVTKKALLYMEEHYAENIRMEELANEIGLSHSYVSHIVSKLTGQSLTENLLYIRCRKARELLRKGVPVGEVFDRVGFASISYFSRTYKRMLGVTPSAHYRKATK